MFFYFPVFSQIQEKGNNLNNEIEEKIENYSENLSSEADLSDIFELHENLLEHPININTANASELKQIPSINEFQIRNLINYIKTNGKLFSILELQAVEGFDLVTISKIKPYMYVSENEKSKIKGFKQLITEGENVIFVRNTRPIELAKGYLKPNDSTPSKYLGSPDKIYLRYKYNYYKNVKINFIAEKDGGEEIFGGTQKQGFDFYSASFFLSDVWVFKSLAIGDYKLSFGQGLTLWSGLALGKSYDAISIKKLSQEIKPYTSVDENKYLRGIASTVKIRNVEISAFYSKKKIDANYFAGDTIMYNNYVSSFQTTGLHRSTSEIADKDAATQTLIGSHVSYQRNDFIIGTTLYNTSFDVAIQKTLKPYNIFGLKNNKLTNFGADYSYVFKNVNLFGEAAYCSNGGTAFLNGIILNCDDNFSFALLHRNYARNYVSLYSCGIGENSTNSNENGIYLGALYKILPSLSLNAYADFARYN